jgi:ribosomal protein S18 acetylase RimI-like enzyme
MPYQIVPATDVDFEAFVQGFNKAYENYFVTIQLLPATMQALIQRDAIDLASSVATLDENQQIVGVAMLAIRPPRSWVGGVGVIEGHRRQGLAQKMMEQLIANARKKNLAAVELEVITQNTGAYTLYKALGFETQRRLLILNRDEAEIAPVKGYKITTCSPFEALAYFEEFHEVPNAWQRSLPALQALALNSMGGWTIASQDAPEQILGYAIGWANEGHIQWMDIAIDPQIAEQAEIAKALLSEVHHQFPDASGGIVNLSEADPSVSAFKAIGFHETMAQYEMRLKL